MRFQMKRHLGDMSQVQEGLSQLRSLHKAEARLMEAPARRLMPPPEFDLRDYVSYLLYIDAEIEHALMIQYLYAAYSLGGPQVPEGDRQMVQGWQEVILGIAKEEMGHLLSVQNVLRLIGAPLNLGREDYPLDTPFYPFPFMLEPLTLDALAKYVYAESPPDWTGPTADDVKDRIKKFTPNPHRVGELFEQLIPLLKDPDYLADEVFQADTYPFQAKWDEWGRGYEGGARGNATQANPKDAPDVLITPCASRDDAVNSLNAIAQQGEANPTVQMDNPSHFARFLKIYEEMADLAKEGWSPARNVAINPYVQPMSAEDPAEGEISNEERDPIIHPEARLWGYLLNVRYRMVLHYLAHSFDLAGGLNQAGVWTPRGAIINATFGEMYNLRAIANIMVQIPLSAAESRKDKGKTAGPPFSVPYTLNLPIGEANRWRLHKDLLLAAEPLIAQLLRISPQSCHDYLFSLREADKKLLDVVNRILAGDVNLALT